MLPGLFFRCPSTTLLPPCAWPDGQPPVARTYTHTQRAISVRTVCRIWVYSIGGTGAFAFSRHRATPPPHYCPHWCRLPRRLLQNWRGSITLPFRQHVARKKKNSRHLPHYPPRHTAYVQMSAGSCLCCWFYQLSAAPGAYLRLWVVRQLPLCFPASRGSNRFDQQTTMGGFAVPTCPITTA